MDITPFVDSLRRDLQAAAVSGGPELQQAAERLGYALDSSARLAIMEAVSQAASEITAELPAGGVEVRLEGRDLAFAVQAPPAPPPPAPAPPTLDEPDGDLSRITLRIPESVKAKAEERAARAGQSLNTWLVQVVRNATSDTAINIDLDLSSLPFFGGGDAGRPGRSNKRMTGWV